MTVDDHKPCLSFSWALFLSGLIRVKLCAPLLCGFPMLSQFALPHIMGWDWLTNQSPKGINGSGSPSKVNPKQHFNLEWDR